MVSIAARTLHATLRLSRLKRRFATVGGVHWMIRWRRRAPPATPPAWLRRRFAVTEHQVGEMAVFTIGPRHAGRGSVFYLHGGAYVFDVMPSHWRFVAGLVRRTGVTVTVPRYALAPESGCARTFAAVLDAYRDFLEGIDAPDVTVMGDSAGGGMALALAQGAMAERLPGAGQVVLLSPWLDLSMSHPDIADVDEIDPFIGADAAVECGRLYLDGLDPCDPRASPVYGPLRGLPPVALFTGTLDILNPDARLLRDRAAEEGVSLSFHEYPMLHTWMMMPLPESRQAQRIIDRLVKRGPAQGQRTRGGIDERIEATFPPVLSPNSVPRS